MTTSAAHAAKGVVLAEADALAATYPGARVPALASVTFRVHSGERVAVLGPNGGGKSTLFRLLTGELASSYGTLALPAGRVALVPQTDRSRLDFPVSALDVAVMGALARLPWHRRPSRGDRDLARRALDRVGLTDEAQLSFGDLSGGQRQRVLVARALVQEARLLALDEPFSGLDAQSAQQLEQLLAELAAEGRGVLMATHDLEQARAADLVLCVNRVQLAFGPPRTALTAEVIERTYGSAIVPLEGSRAVLPPHHHDDGPGHAAGPDGSARGGDRAVIDFVTEPLESEFVLRALAELLLLAPLAGSLGVWIVLRGMSYGAESLAHGMLPGLVLASLAGVPLVLGGAAGLLVAALAIALVGRVPRLDSDVAVSVVVTSLLGLGVLLALSPRTPAGLGGLLFGDVLAVTDGDLLLTAAAAVLTLAALTAAHAGLLAVGFDPLGSGALGRDAARYDALLAVLLALATLAAVQALGSLLVVAMLVGPAATARLVSRRVVPMMLIATAVAALCSVVGIYVSFYAESGAGASVTCAIVFAYALVLAWRAAAGLAGRHGAGRPARGAEVPA